MWTWRDALHFALAGISLFVGAQWHLGTVFLEFQRVHLSLTRLRIDRPAGIYSRNVQLELAGSVLLALAGLIPFRAVRLLGQKRRSGLSWARWAALMLLAGIPAGLILWWKAGADSAEGGFVAQMISDLSLLVRLAGLLLLAQAALGIWYQIASFSARTARVVRSNSRGKPACFEACAAGGNHAVAGDRDRVRGMLAVMTDWLYEMPVSRPVPGQLLYATSFDAFNDEWDLYPGRDAAQIAQSSELVPNRSTTCSAGGGTAGQIWVGNIRSGGVVGAGPEV